MSVYGIIGLLRSVSSWQTDRWMLREKTWVPAAGLCVFGRRNGKEVGGDVIDVVAWLVSSRQPCFPRRGWKSWATTNRIVGCAGSSTQVLGVHQDLFLASVCWLGVQEAPDPRSLWDLSARLVDIGALSSSWEARGEGKKIGAWERPVHCYCCGRNPGGMRTVAVPHLLEVGGRTLYDIILFRCDFFFSPPGTKCVCRLIDVGS